MKTQKPAKRIVLHINEEKDILAQCIAQTHLFTHSSVNM